MMIPLEWMPPLMFAGLVIFMIIGYPVAFSLAAVGFFFGFLSIEMGYFTMAFMQAIPGRVFGSILSNELLLAIPFFTFMGAILERCGLAEDLLDGMGQLFGPVRGGLAYAVIFVGAVLGVPLFVIGVLLGSAPARAVVSRDRAALWLGPDEWLVLAPEADTGLARLDAGGHPASVVDVSHRHASIEISGPAAVTCLNASCALDLHIAAFPVGMCTRTLLGKAEIVARGFDAAVVNDVVNKVTFSEYKRRQAAPGLRVSPRAFGVGRRIPVAQMFRTKA